jgi:hypothetical protein
VDRLSSGLAKLSYRPPLITSDMNTALTVLGAIADLAGIVHDERRDLHVEPRRCHERMACNRHASGLRCLSGAAKRKKSAGAPPSPNARR